MRGGHPSPSPELAPGLGLGALGEFAANTRLGNIPDDVVDCGRLLLLDTIGALLGGLRYPEVRRLAGRLVTGGGGEPDGPIPAAPFGLLVTLGAAATWLDTDSGGAFHPQGHRLPPVPTAHPAPHSLPVLLHAAAHGLDDRRLLEIFLVANEIGMRAGTATSLRPGLHPHGIHGPSGAAVAAGVLRGLDAEQLTASFTLASSLPLAATLAAPMRGGTVRNLWTGLGAAYGASVVGLVAGGARAADGGFAVLHDGAVSTDLSLDQLLGELGSRWELANSYLKPYACARWIHPALDAMGEALLDGGIVASEVASEVEAVEVDTFAFAASLDARAVDSDLHARFSLPYCLAALAVDGELLADGFLGDRLGRPELAEFAARVRVREEPSYSAALPRERPTRVTVRARDGRTGRAEVRNARGNPADPLSAGEVAEKLRRNVADSVPAEVIEAMIAALTGSSPTTGRGDTIEATSRAAMRALASG
ncbi:MAG: MmgE/PrpD family protein [Actinomycetota bacterium]|nr:MmgE/PrpD family protein [Actinomycetota bacterium]